jgi:hypothetical protein
MIGLIHADLGIVRLADFEGSDPVAFLALAMPEEIREAPPQHSGQKRGEASRAPLGVVLYPEGGGRIGQRKDRLLLEVFDIRLTEAQPSRTPRDQAAHPDVIAHQQYGPGIGAETALCECDQLFVGQSGPVTQG